MQYKGTFDFAEYPTPANPNTSGLSSGVGTSETTGRIVRLTAAEIASPTAAILADTSATYLVSGIPVGKFSRWCTDGTFLRPVNGHLVLHSSQASASLTGPLSATVVATVPIPRGVMSPTSSLKITVRITYPNNANNKVIALIIGGVTIFGRTRTTLLSDSFEIMIANRNSLTSQLELGNWQQNGSTWVAGGLTNTQTWAIDFSVDQNLTITFAPAGADTMILEGLCVELLS